MADWATSILSGLGATASQNNLSKLAAWNDCEGNAAGGSGLPINNPFNTTLSFGGASSVNSAGVKHYPDLGTGITATLMTLASPRYAAIVANLKADGPAASFAAAVGSSGWGTSGSCIASKLGAGNVTPAQGGTLTSSTGGTSSGSSDGSAVSNDLKRMGIITAIGTYGPGLLDQKWAQDQLGLNKAVGGGLFSWISNIPVLGSLAVNGSDAVHGAEVAAGIAVWMVKPMTLLRLAEILLGGATIGVGMALYLDVLLPGVGGIVGVVATRGKSLVGNLGSGSGQAAQSASRLAAVKDAELGARETRAANSQMRAERAQIKLLQPSTRALNRFGEEIEEAF